MRIALLFALLAALGNAALAQSQTIYRCGAGGRVLQQHPCDAQAPSGNASTGAPADEKSAAERISRLQATADRMERERLAREARDLRANARAAGIDSRPQPANPPPAALPKQARLHKGGAAGPGKRVVQARVR